MSASKKRPPTTRLIGDAPVLIEGEGGLVVVKGQQTSFPAPAIEPPADDRKPTAPFKHAAPHQLPRPPPLGARLLPTPLVRNFFGGVSAMWLERRLADDPLFPKPRYIAGKRYWEVEELAAWVEAQPREAPDWVTEAGSRGKDAARVGQASKATERAAQKQEPAVAPIAKPTTKRPRPPPVPAERSRRESARDMLPSPRHSSRPRKHDGGEAS